jgi:hypothetical protein
MARNTATEYDALGTYNDHVRSQMGPRNISPAKMGKVKAMMFNAAMSGGLGIEEHLMDWELFEKDKKLAIISQTEKLADIRYMLAHEFDTEILNTIVRKKVEIDLISQGSVQPQPAER